ncbi:MAG: beta-ketoacyl-[acyl-carrier-protein] synthase family protein [Bacteroidales bacterium]|jgi:3-oxoacyl-[acyl-carrier-protein] synthase-1|nr:beta-ketoacyl-[acyl-carrier-protein] synthase family protein [Bacteroidales bacterium]
MRSIVITGAGIVSALGLGLDNTLKALKNSTSGISSIRYLDTIHRKFPVGEVKYSEDELRALLDIPNSQIVTRTALLGMTALQEAFATANINNSRLRMAFISGTTVGGMEKSERYYSDFLNNDSKNDYIAAHDCGACTEMIADHFGGFSMVSTVSTACSSAANAIMLGANLIMERKIDMAIAGGSECITKFHLNGFNTLMILDSQRCRPFDRDRAGLNLGEGAAYIVMESAESAKKRNAPVICRLSGYANTCDAYHQTASSPEGKGAYMAMRQALDAACLQPHDINYINAHGTGTQNNDLSEGTAIMRLFGEHIPPVSSTKPYTGHTTSAAGGVEAVISILSLQHGFIPANLHWQNPMEELDFTPVIQYKETPLKHVLSNSFGFGGNDSALVFSSPAQDFV